MVAALPSPPATARVRTAPVQFPVLVTCTQRGGTDVVVTSHSDARQAIQCRPSGEIRGIDKCCFSLASVTTVFYRVIPLRGIGRVKMLLPARMEQPVQGYAVRLLSREHITGLVLRHVPQACNRMVPLVIIGGIKMIFGFDSSISSCWSAFRNWRA